MEFNEEECWRVGSKILLEVIQIFLILLYTLIITLFLDDI